YERSPEAQLGPALHVVADGGHVQVAEIGRERRQGHVAGAPPLGTRALLYLVALVRERHVRFPPGMPQRVWPRVATSARVPLARRWRAMCTRPQPNGRPSTT